MSPGLDVWGSGRGFHPKRKFGEVSESGGASYIKLSDDAYGYGEDLDTVPSAAVDLGSGQAGPELG